MDMKKRKLNRAELRRVRTALNNATSKYSASGRVRSQQPPRQVTLAQPRKDGEK